MYIEYIVIHNNILYHNIYTRKIFTILEYALCAETALCASLAMRSLNFNGLLKTKN